jgi:hypothetical protein
MYVQCRASQVSGDRGLWHSGLSSCWSSLHHSSLTYHGFAVRPYYLDYQPSVSDTLQFEGCNAGFPPRVSKFPQKGNCFPARLVTRRCETILLASILKIGGRDFFTFEVAYSCCAFSWPCWWWRGAEGKGEVDVVVGQAREQMLQRRWSQRGRIFMSS